MEAQGFFAGQKSQWPAHSSKHLSLAKASMGGVSNSSSSTNHKRTKTVATYGQQTQYQAWMVVCMVALTQLVLAAALPMPEASLGTSLGGNDNNSTALGNSTDPAGFGSSSGITSPIVTDVGQKTQVSSERIVLGILMMLAGLLQVFYGFKFIRLTLLVGGFISWALVASSIMIAIRWDLLFETFNPAMYYFWVWFLCGITGAILSFRFFDLGIAMAGALGGFAVAMVIIAAANTHLGEIARYVIICILVIFFAGIATFYERFFIIAGTSVGGAMIFMFGVDEFVQVGFREMLVIFKFVGKTLQYNPTSKVYFMIAGVVVLAALGTAWEHWHHQTPVLVDRKALFRLYGRPFGKRPRRMLGQKIKHRYRKVGWKGILQDIRQLRFLRKRSAESVLFGSEHDENCCYMEDNASQVMSDQPQQQQEGAGPTMVHDASSSMSDLGDGHGPLPEKEEGVVEEGAGSTTSSGLDTKVEVDNSHVVESQVTEGKAEWEPAPITHSTTVSSDSGNIQVVEVYETFPVSVIEETTMVVDDGGMQQVVQDLTVHDAQQRPPLTVIQHHHQASSAAHASVTQSTSSATHASSSSSQTYTSSSQQVQTHTSSSQEMQAHMSSSSSSQQTQTHSSSSHQVSSQQTYSSSSQQMQTHSSSSQQMQTHSSSSQQMQTHTSSSQTHMSSSEMYSSSSAAYATHSSSARSVVEGSTTLGTRTTTTTTTTSRGMTQVSSTVRSHSSASGGVVTTTTTTTTTSPQIMDGNGHVLLEGDETTRDVPRLAPDSEHA